MAGLHSTQSLQAVSVADGFIPGAIVVQCKPVQGREAAARVFIRETFRPDCMPSLVRMSLCEVDSATGEGSGPHWVLLLESSDVARMALDAHGCLLGCESGKTGLLVGSWTRYQLISAQDRALHPGPGRGAQQQVTA